MVGSITTMPPRHGPLWLVAVAMIVLVPGIGWASMNVPGDSTRLPVLVAVTDERYRLYHASLPAGAAQTAVYGEDLQRLAVVRQTLLRMAAWMNYLSLPA